METAYEPIDKTMLSPNQKTARACVFSALSIASRLDLSSQMPVSIDADICASKAHHLLMYTTEHISSGNCSGSNHSGKLDRSGAFTLLQRCGLSSSISNYDMHLALTGGGQPSFIQLRVT